MLSSDHSPTLPELKLLDSGDFLKAWGGVSSLQVRIKYLLYIVPQASVPSFSRTLRHGPIHLHN